jgi:hypothetical protein
MSKGIATETIVKVMLCIIAILIVTYLVYRYVLKSAISEQECKTRFTAWCTNCRLSTPGCAPFAGGPEPDKGLKECANRYNIADLSSASSCVGFDSQCKGYLAITNCNYS